MKYIVGIIVGFAWSFLQAYLLHDAYTVFIGPATGLPPLTYLNVYGFIFLATIISGVTSTTTGYYIGVLYSYFERQDNDNALTFCKNHAWWIVIVIKMIATFMTVGIAHLLAIILL